MNMKNNLLWASGWSLVLLLFIQSCKSDPDPYANNSLTLSFSNKVGSDGVVLGSGNYKNAVGEDFTVTTFSYFISNISLKKADGTVYTYPQDSSYFLIREANIDSKKVVLKGVPTGDFTELKFMIGVDSLRNTMDLSRRKGVLDPGDISHDDGMYWSWNSGYIFLKLEGNSSKVAADATGNQKFRYHIGGFGGYNTKTFNNIRTVTLPLGSIVAKVGPAQQPTIEVVADIAKIFDGTQKISLAQYPTVMFADFSSTVANNYAAMFKISGVKD